MRRTRDVCAKAWWVLALVSSVSAHALTPPLLIHDSPAHMPEDAEEHLPACDVTVDLTVDAQGDVSSAQVRTPCHPLLDAAAMDAALGLKFEPAMQGPTAVPFALAWRFHFSESHPASKREGEATLWGEVRERGTRFPLPEAVLFVDGQSTPVSVDARGRFVVSLPPGVHSVRVQTLRHAPQFFTEHLRAGESVQVLYGLSPLSVSPYETVVRDEAPRREVTRIALTGPEVHEVPGTFGGEPLRAVLLLPGVTTPGSGIAYPVVRGAPPSATGYQVEDIPVPVLFHLLLGPSIIHPDLIEGFTFSPGMSPLETGRQMGGSLVAQVAAPRSSGGVHGSAYIDLLTTGAMVTATLGKPGVGPNITLAGRTSYVGLIAAPIVSASSNSQVRAGLWDYGGRIEQRVGQGTLRLLAFGSSDNLGASTSEGQDLGGGTLGFHRVDLRYSTPLLGGDAMVGGTFSEDHLNLTLFPLGNSLRSELSRLDARLRASYRRAFSDQWSLRVGADVSRPDAVTALTQARQFSSDLTPYLPIFQPHTVAFLAGAWAELRGELGALSLVPGVRVDSYQVLGGEQFWTADPRVSARYRFSDAWTLKGGITMVHQPATVLLDLPVVDLSALRSGIQEGAQSELGVEWRPFDSLEIHTQLFYNPLSKTIEYDLNRVLDDLGQTGLAPVPRGRGRAYGVELFIRKRLGAHFFAWLSYTLSRSERYQRFPRYSDTGAAVENVYGWVPFAFDQTHVLNLVASYQLPRGWTLGATLHFNTGRPESGEISSTTLRPGYDGRRIDYGEDPHIWVQQDRDRVSRLPSFWRVDARISKKWVYETFVFEAYLDVLNASIRNETFFYEYSEDQGRLARKPLSLPIVVPMLGFKGTY